jgi:hypothetical protein
MIKRLRDKWNFLVFDDATYNMSAGFTQSRRGSAQIDRGGSESGVFGALRAPATNFSCAYRNLDGDQLGRRFCLLGNLHYQQALLGVRVPGTPAGAGQTYVVTERSFDNTQSGYLHASPPKTLCAKCLQLAVKVRPI